MKRMFKFIGIIALVAVIGFTMTACSNGSGGGKKGGGGEDGSSTLKIKANLTGARAILASEGGSGSYSISSRAVGVGSTLFKALESGSVAPIFDEYEQMPNVLFIVRTPVAGKKDFYVCFAYEWWADDETISQLIHVKENGSIVNVSGNSSQGGWSYLQYNDNDEPVAFDQSGNLYFTASQNSGTNYTNIIYKYNPGTGTKQQLTAPISNIYYQKMELSSDGTYLIAKGNRWNNNNSVDFLRFIPTANPDSADYIYYRSGGGGWINSFAHNPRKKELYLSGQNIYDDGSGNNWQSGLYKVSIGGLSRDDWQWATLLDSWSSYDSDYYEIGYMNTIFVASDDSIWGIVRSQNKNRNVFARLINKDGKPDFYVSKSTENMIIVSARSSGSHLYFSADVTTGSQETGYHNIYQLSYSDPDSVKNLLNISNMEIFSFDVGGDYLYFGGTQGINILTGKVNINTGEYTKLDFGQRVTGLVVY